MKHLDIHDAYKAQIEDNAIRRAELEHEERVRLMSIETANGKIVFQRVARGNIAVDIYQEKPQGNSVVPAATCLLPEELLPKLARFIGGLV